MKTITHKVHVEYFGTPEVDVDDRIEVLARKESLIPGIYGWNEETKIRDMEFYGTSALTCNVFKRKFEELFGANLAMPIQPFEVDDECQEINH
jgi:hypothetical protein